MMLTFEMSTHVDRTNMYWMVVLIPPQECPLLREMTSGFSHQLKGSGEEPNNSLIYETEKIVPKVLQQFITIIPFICMVLQRKLHVRVHLSILHMMNIFSIDFIGK